MDIHISIVDSIIASWVNMGEQLWISLIALWEIMIERMCYPDDFKEVSKPYDYGYDYGQWTTPRDAIAIHIRFKTQSQWKVVSKNVSD